MTQLHDEHLRPAGLRTSQFSVLVNLRHDAGLSMGELAARLTMDRTTLTRNLRPPTDAGWIASRPDPDDHQRTRLALNPAGREVLRAAVPRWRKAQRALRERIGDGTVLALQASIDDTLEHLE